MWDYISRNFLVVCIVSTALSAMSIYGLPSGLTLVYTGRVSMSAALASRCWGLYIASIKLSKRSRRERVIVVGRPFRVVVLIVIVELIMIGYPSSIGSAG